MRRVNERRTWEEFMMEPFVIRQITAGKPDLIAASSGDSWDPTQGPDGRYYAASNDTAGFHGGDRNNVNFNVVEADGLSGATVNRMPEYGKQGEEKEDGRTWKTSGCYCVDGVLYLVAGRHCYGDESGDVRKRQTVINASILKSADFGKTWTRSESENYHDPMFPSDFCTPYFIHYGQDGAAPDVDNAQQYIYAVSNNGFLGQRRLLRPRQGAARPARGPEPARLELFIPGATACRRKTGHQMPQKPPTSSTRRSTAARQGPPISRLSGNI